MYIYLQQRIRSQICGGVQYAEQSFDFLDFDHPMALQHRWDIPTKKKKIF